MAAVNRDESYKYKFCDLATQYYAAGRLAAQAGIAPVHANLLHHAVEMYLKGALVGTLSPKQMSKQPYVHDLKKLWEGFKTKEGDAALVRFDAAVRALHEFDSIRYPDKIVEQGMATGVSWDPGDLTFGGTIPMPPMYVVSIHEVDELVIEILRRASVNPKAIPTIHSAGRAAIEYHNPRAADWRL